VAFRSDVTVDWSVSPRIITVQAPSDEITVQDLVDTCRELEQQSANMVYEELIKSSLTGGKQPLGGGTLVGITTTLNDAQVAFEARTQPAEEGTVTSAGINVLTDNTADFESAGVARGSMVINLTDGSISDVLDVIDANNLTVVGLTEGTENDFDVGEAYMVWNIDTVTVSGGNLVAVDDVGGDLAPILPTWGTQVNRTSSSSATLQELEAVQFSSYNGGVTVDLTSTYTGTLFPVGTAQEPVNNFSDALDIADERGFNTFFVVGNATVDTGLDFTDMVFVGQGISLSTLTLAAAADFTNAEFKNATIVGTLDGNSTARDCQIGNINYITGVVCDCILAGTIVLSGSQMAQFINCVSGVPGTGTPVIDMGGDGPELSVRNYAGGLKIINKSGTDNVSIDMNSGQVILDSTVTAGTLVVRGISKLVDNSVGATVSSNDLLQPADMNDAASRIGLVEKILRNRMETDPVAGTITIYDDDSITPLITAPLYENVAGTQTYRGLGAERRDRMV
jgi:hypothetical protein